MIPIPTLTLLFLGAVSAARVTEVWDGFRPAPSCSSTGTFTYTYSGIPTETDIDGEDHPKARRAVADPTTITVTGCPWETHSPNDFPDGDDDDFPNTGNMSMDMGELDLMFKPGLHTITRQDGPATTFTTTMIVSEASDNSFWTTEVVQTIVVVTGTSGSSPAAATSASGGSSGNVNNGNGNAASRLGDLAAVKAIGGVIGGGLLLLAFM